MSFKLIALCARQNLKSTNPNVQMSTNVQYLIHLAYVRACRHLNVNKTYINVNLKDLWYKKLRFMARYSSG